jgi:hypothetical protein
MERDPVNQQETRRKERNMSIKIQKPGEGEIPGAVWDKLGLVVPKGKETDPTKDPFRPSVGQPPLLCYQCTHFLPNLVKNGDFSEPSKPFPDTDPYVIETVKETTGTSDQEKPAGDSAALWWTLFNNTPGLIRTELLELTYRDSMGQYTNALRRPPKGENRPAGTTMLRVRTTGPGNGLVQEFATRWGMDVNVKPAHMGWPYVTAYAWVFLVKGQMVMGTGEGGNIVEDVVLRTRNSWHLLQSYNGFTPASEIIFYQHGDGEAEFYVKSVLVTPLLVPPAPM